MVEMILGGGNFNLSLAYHVVASVQKVVKKTGQGVQAIWLDMLMGILM